MPDFARVHRGDTAGGACVDEGTTSGAGAGAESASGSRGVGCRGGLGVGAAPP